MTRRMIFTAEVLFTIVISAFGGDYTITSFTAGGRAVPQQTDEVIALTADEELFKEVSSLTPISPGEVVMRRRFSGEEYRLYKGVFAKDAFSKETNLFSFALPPGMPIEEFSTLKFYSDRVTNPNNDIPTVYFDNTHAYVRIISRLYYNTGKWQELLASNVKVDAGKAQPIGDIAVTSTPPGARISVDGEDKGVLSPNYVAGLFAGQHKVSVSLQDYQPAEKVVEVKAGEVSNLSFDLLSALGGIEITTIPSGATVTCNNVESGKTPVILKNLKPGIYTIGLVLALYKSQSKQVTVSMNKKEVLGSTLEPDFGTLSLPKPPSNIQYTVDGGTVSTSTIRLNPGKHRITWNGGEEYSAIDTVVTIAIGATTQFSLTPVRLTGGLKIMPIPMDAEVFVNGESKGTGAKNVSELPTGIYTVSGKRDGFQLTKIKVNVRSKETETVNLNLEKIPDRDGDGVEDGKDKCPDEAGMRENAGCKEKPGFLADIDGNVYHTVQIGMQEWTVENLRTTKYSDGTPIPILNSASKKTTTPCYCNYYASKSIQYGRLYSWYAVDTKRLAPKGWRVPSDEDWKNLEKYLGDNGYNWDSSKMGSKIAKSLAAQTDWPSLSTSILPGAIGYDLTKNNKSGFSALPGGIRDGDGNGKIHYNGTAGGWWSSSENNASKAWSRRLYNDMDILRKINENKGCFLSVRLVRDSEGPLVNQVQIPDRNRDGIEDGKNNYQDKSGPKENTGDKKAIEVKKFIDNGNLLEAQRIIEELVSAEPENIDVLMLRGKIQMLNKNYDEAVETYKEILYIDPYHAPSLVGRGNVYLKQSKLKWAETFFERALTADPNNALAELGLARTYKMLKNVSGFKQHLEKAYSLDPNNPEIADEYKKSR